MQELIFNTTQKTIEIKKDYQGDKIYHFNNISTVKYLEGFYEVIQESDEIDEKTGKPKKYPIFRLPISNTNMRIIK